MIEEFAARLCEFGGKGLVKKSAFRDGAAVLQQVLTERKVSTALEIGTYRGVSAAWISRFVGRMTTIDLVDGRAERKGEKVEREALWSAMGINNIALRLVRDDAEKAEMIRSLAFDFAFIDGDHTGDAPARDFELVKQCGNVLFHDYGARNGVTSFVRSLPQDQVRIIGIFAHWRAS